MPNYLLKKKGLRLKPPQKIALGFALVILFGGLLLSMPFSSSTGKSVGFLAALFTSTSAVCVTGLVVVDTGTAYSLVGQLIVLSLIQFGGLGFMTVATTVFMLLGKRITLHERMVLQESLNEFDLRGLVRFTKYIIFTTFGIEFIGAVLLSFRFIPQFGIGKGIFFSFFHAISAFCNAGFDLFGNFRNLTGYAKDPLVNFVIMGLIIIGGLGFYVLLDIKREKFKWKKLKFHTKTVLSVTAVLLALGTLFFFLTESNNPKTIGDGSYTFGEQVMASAFQSVTPRTAGYNTISQADLNPASKALSVLLMFIGASPASTGGGIKTTTAFVLLLAVMATLHQRDSAFAFKRRLDVPVMQRAFTLFMLALTLVFSVTLGIMLIEGAHGASLHFVDVLFESTSAFGTVGLSSVGTPSLHTGSRILLILSMYAGRIGPITLMLALSRAGSKKVKLRPPEGRIMIG